MYKVLIFAGTSEGITLCNLLAENKIYTHVCVATEYGSLSYEKSEYLNVHANRLNQEEMTALMKELQPELVLDATHPYAAEVTKNICAACKCTGYPYQRVLRERGEYSKAAVYVDNTEAAVEYLAETQGNILLTTGSKELAKYTAISDYRERLYARVLSLPSVMGDCSEYGITGKHLIGMQGPFSKEMNMAMLRQFDCKYLVTKDTGKAGGFQEKLDAAYECDVIPVVIGRPIAETGMSVAEAKQMLAKRFGFVLKPHVTVLGIGMGNEETMTVQGKHAVEKADLLIGAKRMVDAVCRDGQDVLYEYRSEEISRYIEEHPWYENIVIALSGDVGFYSGAKKLLSVLNEKTEAEVICGISSVVYFMSKIGLSWDDAKLVSSHGCDNNLLSMIRFHKKVFSIMGTAEGVSELAKKLVYYGMEDTQLYVGENLSYENERIFSAKADELTEYEASALSVVCVWNPDAVSRCETHGLEDADFIRGKAPMTKSEVRTVSLAKLKLEKDSVCYDVGAGTGSVSVEMALRAYKGSVYAIEKKDEAVRLLEENKRKFAVDNLTVVNGTAPSALCGLPAPTHAFIGGSSGNLREILMLLVSKNPDVRIVINCITLETVTEALKALKDFEFEEKEIVQLGVSRAKELGSYHLMMGENPIYIITCQYPRISNFKIIPAKEKKNYENSKNPSDCRSQRKRKDADYLRTSSGSDQPEYECNII